jgi:putative ABC transport system substrate-binding protein
MRRREFLAVVAGAMAHPPCLRAQQRATPVIGFLSPESPELFKDRLPAFLQALSDAGYIEGRNLLVEYRWAEGRPNRLPSLATELVERKVAVIVAPGSTPAVFAAKAATETIPVVFFVGSDPAQLGLVASLNRPGGNATGVTTLNAEVGPKRIEYLKELVPGTTNVALLTNPLNPAAEGEARDFEAAARKLAMQPRVVHARSEHDFEPMFAALAEQKIRALVIGTDALFNTRNAQLANLSVHHAIPTVHAWRAFASAGGLMSLGSSISDGYRQVGVYAARILKGENPADLPVEQVTRIELTLNLRTAKALGLTIPPTLLARADEVIE